MAHDRQGDVLGAAGEVRQRRGNRVDVLQWRQRYGHPGLGAEPRRPDADGRDHQVCRDVALGGVHRGNAAVGDSEAGDLDVAMERRTVSLRLARHRLGRPGRVRLDVRRDIDRAQHALGKHRKETARLGGAEQVGLYAPAQAVADLSFQVGEPLRSPSHLQTADGFGARNAVELQLRPQINGGAREARHGLGRVDLEDQSRRVRRGTAGFEEWALIDDNDVPPPERCQVVGHAATGDPGANDDCSSVSRHHAVRHLVCLLDRTTPPSDLELPAARPASVFIPRGKLRLMFAQPRSQRDGLVGGLHAPTGAFDGVKQLSANRVP